MSHEDFDDLARRMRPKLTFIATHHMHDAGEVYAIEDIVQDTLVRVWQALSHKEIEDVEGYMVATLRKAIIDRARRKVVENRYTIEVHEEQSPLDIMFFYLAMQYVTRWLKPSERLMLHAIFLNGDSFEKHAADTGRTVPAVKTTLARARIAMRIRLDEYLECTPDPLGRLAV